MKAVIQTGYGSADVMDLKEIEKPVPGDGEVLVRVQAASLAAGDYFGMRGKPFPIRMVIGFPRPKKDHVVGLDVVKAFLLSLFVRRQGRPFVSTPNQDDLVTLKELVEAGRVAPVIDRTYPLREAAEAFRYLDQAHARGKVVIVVANGE